MSQEKPSDSSLPAGSTVMSMTSLEYKADGSPKYHLVHSNLDETPHQEGHGLHANFIFRTASAPPRHPVGHAGLSMSRPLFEGLASRANPPVTDIKIPAGPESRKVCVACKVEDHTVRRCIRTDIKGVIPVCPFCES